MGLANRKITTGDTPRLPWLALSHVGDKVSKKKRPDKSYRDAAKHLAKFIPSLKPLAKAKRLTPSQKGQIARRENQLRGTEHLKPLSKKEAAALKDYLYEPVTAVKSGPNRGKLVTHHGIQGIMLRNTSSKAKPIKIEKNLFALKDHGRLWAYWGIEKPRPAVMRELGRRAFADPAEYSIDRVMQAARRAFESPETKGVYLWSDRGRVGEPITSFAQFKRWIADDFARYKQPDQWVKGIAVLVADVDEDIGLQEFSSFSRRMREPGEDDEDFEDYDDETEE